MDKPDQNLDRLFELARTQAPKTGYEKAKNNFMANSGTVPSSGWTQFISSHMNLILIGTLTVFTTIGIVLFSNQADTEALVTETESSQIPNSIPFQPDSAISPKQEQEHIMNEFHEASGKQSTNTIQQEVALSLAQKFREVKLDKTNLPKISMKNGERVLPPSKSNADSIYVFPNLTAEEKKANHKEKARMMRQLAKMDKKQYAFVPGGAYQVEEVAVPVKAFYMQTGEVSNIEYRTFLFDLLIQGRKSDFLMAKPDQQVWTKDYPFAFNEPMVEQYFSHPAYDNYPVVGVSRQGALMYCDWLTRETNSAFQDKLKTPLDGLRLPTDQEWTLAAKGEKKEGDPFSIEYLTNEEGCWLANFKPDSGDYSSDGAFHTAQTKTYIPNGFGLYNLAGNVAEMVWYVNEPPIPGTKGGSWSSEAEELQINGPDPFKGKSHPSSSIGFRPVISHMGNGKDQVPPGTVKVREGFYFDKTEITNFNWKEYRHWLAEHKGKNSQEYLQSQIDTNVWAGTSAVYTNLYAWHPAFHNYPVVGVSYEQATRYCQWRSDRVNELFQLQSKKNGKALKTVNYRLPTKEEWEQVAQAASPSSDKKKYESAPKFNLKRGRNPDPTTVDSTGSKDITAPAESYWPNHYGIYNIIGNVAEMLEDEGVSKGGSWQHTAAEAKLETNISYKAPQSWLGFRCVCEVD